MISQRHKLYLSLILLFSQYFFAGCATHSTAKTISFGGYAIDSIVLPSGLKSQFALDPNHSESGIQRGVDGSSRVKVDRILIYSEDRSDYISIWAQEESGGFFRGENNLDIASNIPGNIRTKYLDWDIIEISTPSENRWICVQKIEGWGDVMVVLTPGFSVVDVHAILCGVSLNGSLATRQ